ncbi:heat-inducible transcription repressor HrcA [Alkalithermobacter thermoalcaliphilus JW-YL-7 = DSM 7308]|uniref:Heat-inducible transcription repressor HrcA n=1 Tax=Alkalithermobacter thermoalcaliphilus JW-YL-7 = DSM 7308 TaxID=1121328 RepID=A0A150FR54_CLOPD|nr:heat-inducible transcription repressor HrcA [[Clostridium] paradoxum JW-YL-7 = DSM 7308]SHL01287.1 heat-inducible transcription repressor HrcA [[Clostridium] paradoxum JW-YL-7 = DSM 7308]
MSLSDRRLKILEAIVKDYIMTAEAVGSRTISKKYDLGVSAATIRNEMADLEEMGYLIQPHTSAGRIPSEKGYRLYVDTLMTRADLDQVEQEIIKKCILSNVGQMKNLLEETVKLLSRLTNYTAIGVTPQLEKTKIKHIQLVKIDSNNVLLILVTDTGVVKNTTINTPVDLSDDKLDIISKILREKIVGKDVYEIDENFIRYIKSEMVNYSRVIDSIFKELSSGTLDPTDFEVLLSGATNIFNFPEFNDIVKAKAFLNMLEQKEKIAEILNTKGIQKDNVNIVIGTKSSCEIAKDCSIITAIYSVGGKTIGKLGIIGPTRMDYSKVYASIDYVGKILNDIFNKE